MALLTLPPVDPAPIGGADLPAQSLALDAQAALLPYALALFGIALPIYVWAGSFAPNASWMAASFAIFAINFGAFYGALNWLKTPAAQDVALRGRVHIMGGLLWAVAVAQIAAFASGAGPMRDILLSLAAGGAAICMVFASPTLGGLLLIGPAAAAGPLLVLFTHPGSRNLAVAAWGAFALAMALALILNRLLRRQFALAAAHDILTAQRTEVLAQTQRLARSKSDILATVSHEIRNGLTGVTHVLAAACGQGFRGAPSREQLNAALNAANDLLAVLNATLDSETAQSGRLALDTQAFDPVRLIRDVALLERPNAAAKGLELSIHIEPELEAGDRGAAIADPMRARQVLGNLIGNAVKYTVRGRVELRVERRGDAVAFHVADTGPGLSPEELDRAFEAFRRVERTGAGVAGAGLGLSLSRDLADLMGGSLEAGSAIGVGSCFTLTLPFDAAAPLPEAIAAPEQAFHPADRHSRPLRVLVAEDDALNAAMMRAILEQLGHQVVHAQNGRRAVELAQVWAFDLLMLDGRMPGLDGAGATAAIRDLDGPAGKTPIIAVIGGEADEAAACLAAGADTVLRKPVSVAAVARAVADAAEGRREPTLTLAVG
jgi:signal transduction histidine kinase/ActR/RegA family two-component response regulator